MAERQGPLTGIRVLELGSFIAGPFAGQLLGDYGADVIKVESPDRGDPMRHWGVTTPGGDSLWWPAIGRNKRSVAADLSASDGLDLVQRLARHSDVIVENFRPGRLSKWGLDYATLSVENPGLVMVHVSGFGQTGPRSSEPGFGSVGEAVGGIRHTTGDPDRPPARCGISLGDSLAGLFAVIGALAALSERSSSGRGQEVDVAIYEAVAALMESTLADYEVGGVERTRSGGTLPGVAPANAYPAADGSDVLLAGNADGVFTRLTDLMGQPQLATDERFATHAARGAHAAELDALVAHWTVTLESDALLDALSDAGVPAGRVYTAADVLNDPQYLARDMVHRAVSRAGVEVPMAGVVPRFGRTPGAVADVGADLGEHTSEVRAELDEGRVGGQTASSGSGAVAVAERPGPAAGQQRDLAAGFVGRCESLAPLLAEQAAEAEQLRRLPEATLEAARSTGLFDAVVPASLGGQGLGLDALAHGTRAMAHGCPASAWTLSFFMLHGWMLSKLPAAGRDEVFANGVPLVPAPLAPTGNITEVHGGYQLTGKWEWATGVSHADWVLVHAVQTEPEFSTRFLVLPIDEVEVADVWFTSGMAATGSNTVRVNDRFVPAQRTVDARVLMYGEGGTSGDGGVDSDAALAQATGDGLANLAVPPVLALVASAPALGAAEAAVDLYRQRLTDRVLAYSLGDKAAEQPAAQVRLATAMSDLASAKARWESAVGSLSAAAESTDGVIVQLRVDSRLAAAATVRSARSVFSTVCEGAGASVFFTSSPLQRLRRDVDVLGGHVIFDWDRTAELAGRFALGMPLRSADLV